MSKLGERLLDHEGKVIVRRTFDATGALEFNRQLRDRGENFGESKIIGSAPASLVGEWLKEAGVRWDDPAADEVIKKKLMSGEVSKLRVWEGTY